MGEDTGMEGFYEIGAQADTQEEFEERMEEMEDEDEQVVHEEFSQTD